MYMVSILILQRMSLPSCPLTTHSNCGKRLVEICLQEGSLEGGWNGAGWDHQWGGADPPPTEFECINQDPAAE